MRIFNGRYLRFLKNIIHIYLEYFINPKPEAGRRNYSHITV